MALEGKFYQKERTSMVLVFAVFESGEAGEEAEVKSVLMACLENGRVQKEWVSLQVSLLFYWKVVGKIYVRSLRDSFIQV